MNIVYKFRKLPFCVSILVLIIGFYFSWGKAGIPYQDPTPEMTTKYMFYWNMGNKFLLIGFIILIISVAFWIIIVRLKKGNTGNN